MFSTILKGAALRSTLRESAGIGIRSQLQCPDLGAESKILFQNAVAVRPSIRLSPNESTDLPEEAAEEMLYLETAEAEALAACSVNDEIVRRWGRLADSTKDHDGDRRRRHEGESGER